MIRVVNHEEPRRNDSEQKPSPRPSEGVAGEVSYRVGKLAYEAFRAAAGGRRSLFANLPLPPWSLLKQEAREAWHAAADAVWNDCVAMHRSRGGVL